jgi:hypothetical protein
MLDPEAMNPDPKHWFKARIPEAFLNKNKIRVLTYKQPR